MNGSTSRAWVELRPANAAAAARTQPRRVLDTARGPDAGGIDDVLDLYRHMDPSFADLLTDTVQGSSADQADMEMDGLKDPFIRDMRNAGRMLSDASGTRVAAIDITGWDTTLSKSPPTDGWAIG